MAHTGYPLATKILASTFQGAAFSRATTGEIRIYQDDDPPDDDGTGGTEIGNGHVPAPVNFDAATWTVTGLTGTNDVAITGSQNGTGVVTATHYAVFDSADELMFVGALSAPIEIASGVPFQISAGEIDFTVGGGFTDNWGNDVLDHILTGAAITWPTTELEVSLVSTSPTASAAGTEVTGTAYARISVEPSAANFTVTDADCFTVDALDYVDAGSDWTDPIGHNVYLADGTTRLFFMNYGSAKPVTTGNGVGWPAGSRFASIL